MPGGGVSAGVASAQWTSLIDRLIRGVERGGRQWTAARKKDAVRRVLDHSRTDAQRLHDRLHQLALSWDSDGEDAAVETVPGELQDLLAKPPAQARAAARGGVTPGLVGRGRQP